MLSAFRFWTLAVLAAGSALLSGTWAALPFRQEIDKSPKAFAVRFDVNGDPLPPGAVARVGSTRLYHRGGIQSLTFAPAGGLVASTDDRGTVYVWEASSGKLIRRWQAHAGICCLAISPLGRTVATGGEDEMIRLWDWASGKELRELTAMKQGRICALAFAADGCLASASADANVRIWNPNSGKELTKFQGHAKSIRGLAFSPNSMLLASAEDGGEVHLWDPRRDKAARKLGEKIKASGRVAFSPDGNILAAASANDTVYLWNVADGKLLRRLENGRTFAFLPDGKTLIVGGPAGLTVLYDWQTGRELRRLGFLHSEQALALSPDGQILAASDGFGKTFYLWQLPHCREIRPWQGHRRTIHSLGLSDDGKLLLTAGEDDAVHLWDAATGRERRRIEDTSGTINAAALAPDGKTLATSSNISDLIHVVDVESGKETRRFRSQGGANRLSFSRDGTVLAALVGGAVRRWETATGKALASIAVDRGGPLVFGPDGKYLVPWHLPNGELPDALAKTGGGFFLSLPRDGRTLTSCGADGAVTVWEAATGRQRRRFQGHEGEATAAAFSADGRFLVTASADRTALIWDLLAEPPEEKSPALPQAIWTDLEKEDAAVAHRAVRALIRQPATLAALVREHLMTVRKGEDSRIVRLIEDLDNDAFAVRENASAELRKLGGRADKPMEQALQNRPTLEVRMRLERLLAKSRTESGYACRQLGYMRLVEALEYANACETRELLKTLGARSDEDFLSREAKAAWQRLNAKK